MAALSIALAPSEKVGLAYDFTKELVGDATIASVATPSVDTLRGDLTLHSTDGVVRAENKVVDLTVTVPAESSGCRWRVTVLATADDGAVLSLAINVVVK